MTPRPLTAEEVESVRRLHPDGECDHDYGGCREALWLATLDAARAPEAAPDLAAPPDIAGHRRGRCRPLTAEEIVRESPFDVETIRAAVLILQHAGLTVVRRGDAEITLPYVTPADSEPQA